MSKKIIFISWTPFGRHTELLGKALCAEIFFIEKFIKLGGIYWKLLFPLDYLLKSIKTIYIILNTKPAIVFIQNPPSIAAVLLIIISKFLKFKSVIDSHNGAFERPWVNLPLHLWALKSADLVTVHNNILFNQLFSDEKFLGIKFRVLNTRLAEFPNHLKESQQEIYFLVVSSFSNDEPMDILLEGISFFSKKRQNIKFKITGNYKKNIELYNNYNGNSNLEFLGFVDRQTYDYLLINSYGVISLSTRDNVQQCALIEAVGAQVPFISSRNATNTDLFDEKMILTEISPNEIEKAITQFIDNKDILKKNIVDIKKNQIVKWDKEFKNLLKELGSIIE